MLDDPDDLARLREALTAAGYTYDGVAALLGPVAHDELPGLVAGAAAFAFPSTKEGFGLEDIAAIFD